MSDGERRRTKGNQGLHDNALTVVKDDPELCDEAATDYRLIAQ
jgi:hypothetical protein